MSDWITQGWVGQASWLVGGACRCLSRCKVRTNSIRIPPTTVRAKKSRAWAQIVRVHCDLCDASGRSGTCYIVPASAGRREVCAKRNSVEAFWVILILITYDARKAQHL